MEGVPDAGWSDESIISYSRRRRRGLKAAMGGEPHLTDVNSQFIALIHREGGISHDFILFVPLTYGILGFINKVFVQLMSMYRGFLTS